MNMGIRCLVFLCCVAASIFESQATSTCDSGFLACKRGCGSNHGKLIECILKKFECYFKESNDCKYYLGKCYEEAPHNSAECRAYYSRCEARNTKEECEIKCNNSKRSCRGRDCDDNCNKCKEVCKKNHEGQLCELFLADCTYTCSKLVNTCPSGCFTPLGAVQCEANYIRCINTCFDGTCRCIGSVDNTGKCCA